MRQDRQSNFSGDRLWICRECRGLWWQHMYSMQTTHMTRPRLNISHTATKLASNWLQAAVDVMPADTCKATHQQWQWRKRIVAQRLWRQTSIMHTSDPCCRRRCTLQKPWQNQSEDRFPAAHGLITQLSYYSETKLQQMCTGESHDTLGCMLGTEHADCNCVALRKGKKWWLTCASCSWLMNCSLGCGLPATARGKCTMWA